MLLTRFGALAALLAADPRPALHDVVIGAFACAVPEPILALMAERAAKDAAPVWINLEYLSAEPYVARSHGLPSPVMSGPGKGLTKHFFYPGFTPETGGLLREAVLFDVYRPKQAAAGLQLGEKSLAVRLTLQDDAATLTETQIEAAVAAVVTQVERDLGARLRA